MPAVIDKRAFFSSIGYEPHSHEQWEYHTDTSRFKVPCCGRRFGKSTMAMRDREPQYLLPERILDWIIGPTYDLGEKEFRVLWDDLIIGKKLGHDPKVRKTYNKKAGDMHIQFPWGPRIEVRSAQYPESLVGEALDHVIVSEAAKHNAETWSRFIYPSLNDKRGTASFPTTPEGHNWLYALWQLGRDPQFKNIYKSWNFPSWLNRVIYPGGYDDPEIQLMLITMNDEEFAQEIGADFSSFAGKIYSEFDENTHVKSHIFRPDWPNYGCFDWGFTDALAFVEFQVDPWGKCYIWREHYKSYTTLEDHIDLIRARNDPDGYRLDCCFGDAADPEATMKVNMLFAPCISMPEAKSNWREGINLVKRLLKLQQVGYDEWERPIEEPWCVVDHSCKHTIKGFNTYRKKDTSVPLTETNAKGAAEKQDDHCLDAFRYGAMHVFELGAQQGLADTQPADTTLWTPQSSMDEQDYDSSGDTIFSAGTVI